MSGSFFGLSLLDNSNETGGTEFKIGDLTAVSLPGALTQMGALKTAIEGVTLGVVSQSRYGDRDFLSRTKPTNPAAQRGVKWTVQMEDDTLHTLFNNTIPTADLSLLASGNEDLDLTTGAGQALKDAIEALVKSSAGNGVIVQRVYYSD